MIEVDSVAALGAALGFCTHSSSDKTSLPRYSASCFARADGSDSNWETTVVCWTSRWVAKYLLYLDRANYDWI
jgi:hypothetical protein